jgi:hypothetical protein
MQLDTNHNALLATAMLSGLFWAIAYVLIIYRGFKDKSYGMPVVALVSNFAWELIYGLGIEPSCILTWESCPATLVQARNFLWLVLDGIILYTVLRFGPRYFARTLGRAFVPSVLAGIAVAALIIYTFVIEYYIANIWGVVPPGSSRATDFLPLRLQGGSDITGFGMNLMMSLLFIFMLLERGSVEGQSIYIAISKWLGTLAAYGFMLADNIQTPLVNVLYATIFVLDVIYIWLVYRQCRREGINPWRRA